MFNNTIINQKEVYIITDAKQRFYFTGFKSSFGYLLLSNTEKVFFTDMRYIVGAKQKLANTDIKVQLATGFNEPKAYILDNGFTKLGIDYSVTLLTEYNLYQQLGLEIFDVSNNLNVAMSVKSEAELQAIKESCKIAQESFYEVIKLLKTGVTEKQIATEFEYIMKQKGAEGVSFDLIVAFGENAAIPHHETDDTKLQENQCVLMDFGCLYKGYCSDMTRTFFYGTPPKQFIDDYNQVLLSAKLAEENITAGDTGIKADGYARESLKNAGLDGYFTHSLGHGIGVNIHEYPRLSFKAEDKLVNGMVFSIEPGIYKVGEYGIRIEDTVALINGKVVRFMTDDKKLFTISLK